jgi:rhodanese-related sulfurtransferase
MVLTLFSLGACSQEPGTAEGPQLSAPQAHLATQQGQLTLIDIRTPQEWRQTGVAKDARLINMQHPQGGRGFLNDVLASVDGDKSRPIGLICRTGNRTTHVQKFLQEQGFTQVYNIKEGMVGSAAGPGWLRQQLPVESCGKC